MLVSSNMPPIQTVACKECCLGPNYFIAILANGSNARKAGKALNQDQPKATSQLGIQNKSVIITSFPALN